MRGGNGDVQRVLRGSRRQGVPGLMDGLARRLDGSKGHFYPLHGQMDRFGYQIYRL